MSFEHSGQPSRCELMHVDKNSTTTVEQIWEEDDSERFLSRGDKSADRRSVIWFEGRMKVDEIVANRHKAAGNEPEAKQNFKAVTKQKRGSQNESPML